MVDNIYKKSGWGVGYVAFSPVAFTADETLLVFEILPCSTHFHCFDRARNNFPTFPLPHCRHISSHTPNPDQSHRHLACLLSTLVTPRPWQTNSPPPPINNTNTTPGTASSSVSAPSTPSPPSASSSMLRPLPWPSPSAPMPQTNVTHIFSLASSYAPLA